MKRIATTWFGWAWSGTRSPRRPWWPGAVTCPGTYSKFSSTRPTPESPRTNSSSRPLPVLWRFLASSADIPDPGNRGSVAVPEEQVGWRPGEEGKPIGGDPVGEGGQDGVAGGY